MARNSFPDDDLPSAPQEIRLASDLVQRGKFEAARELSRHVLETVRRVTSDERLAIYEILMQCPGERFSKKDFLSVERLTREITDNRLEDIPHEERVQAYAIRDYFKTLQGPDRHHALQCAREVLGDSQSSNEAKMAAHLLICHHSNENEEWDRSQDAVLESKNEFAITCGISVASSRHVDPWRALWRLNNKALPLVRHPVNRAKLLTSKVEAYARLLVKQSRHYDPKVNEKHSQLSEDMNACAQEVQRTRGVPHQWAKCLYCLARVDMIEGRRREAETRLSSALQIAETFGMQWLRGAVTKEMAVLKAEE